MAAEQSDYALGSATGQERRSDDSLSTMNGMASARSQPIGSEVFNPLTFESIFNNTEWESIYNLKLPWDDSSIPM